MRVRRRPGRTALAAAVMSFIAFAAWLLLTVAPTYRDLWLVLIGVVGAGAVGAWRADIVAEEQQRRDMRDLLLRGIDDTQRFIQQRTEHLYERSVAVEEGRPYPFELAPPPMAEYRLAGDRQAIIEWIETATELNRPNPPLTLAESRRLGAASASMIEALREQRIRI